MQRDRDLDSLLDEALQLPRDARQAFLDTHCSGDGQMRSAIEAVLHESDQPDPFVKPGGAFDGPLWEDLLAEPVELTTGARLGPYEVRGTLGAGGMGEVYRAHDTRLGRDVAIKVLPAASGSPDALARFEREARAVAALNHPNILAIHDVGADGPMHFVVTELLEGETLRAKLAARGSLAPTEAMGYGVEIARGLAAAHDRGIVHRDLKPENIFVTRDGRVKILDFGIALFDHTAADAPGHSPLTRTGLIIGTVGYMAPEQLLGQPATLRSDLFAFGVVMHEMLSGAHPFKRATAPEIQTAVLREDPRSLAQAVPGLSPSLVRVIERCLEKQPAQRPESARDLAMFLDAIGDAAPGPGPARLADDRTARQLRIPLVAALCGLVVVALATWGYVRVATERAARHIVAADLQRADRVTRRAHEEQCARLELTARLIASFPELKAALATDFATIRDFLIQYQQRTPGLAVLVALGPDGTVLARTDGVGQPAAGRDAGFAALIAEQGTASVVEIGARPSVAVAVALEAASTVFGYLIAAEAIDQRFAEAVSDATQDEVVVLSEAAVLATTLRTAQTPWASLGAWRAAAGSGDGDIDVRIGTQQYIAREVLLAKSPAVSAIVVRSREEAFGPYRSMQRNLMLIGLAVVAGVLLSVLWLPRVWPGRSRRETSQTQPTQRL